MRAGTFRSIRRGVVLTAAILVAFSALVLVGCGDDGENASGGGSADKGSKGTGSLKGDGTKTMALFTMTASNVYGANQIAGAKRAAKEFGYKLTVFQNNYSQTEIDKQVQQYVATGAKPAATVIFPFIADAALNSIRQLASVGPVIMITQPPNKDAKPFTKAYAGANQHLIGEVAAQMLMKARDHARKTGMKLHSKEGNLFVFQHPEGENTGTWRWEGFEKETKDAPFNVIGTEYGTNDPESGYEKASQVIPRIKSKGIDFLYVSNQGAANGVIRALKENGLKPGKDVLIVSSDCSGNLDTLKNGEEFATGLQSGSIEGYLGVVTAARYIAAGKTEGAETQGAPDATMPSFDATPPAYLNYMPHAAAIGPKGATETTLWGYNPKQICEGG